MHAGSQAFAANMYHSVALETGIAASSPHGLVSLLLGGAIERVESARTALQNAEQSLANEKISLACSIVSELRISLNHEQGGGLAADLERLYDYIHRRLLTAQIGRDPSALSEVVDLLSQIHQAWLEIADAASS